MKTNKGERGVLAAGSNAYYMTAFNGPVPCRVERVYDTADLSAAMRFELSRHGVSSRWKCDVVLTAGRAAYKKGERLKGLFAHDVVPRECVRARRNGNIIVYAFKVSA